MKNILILVSVLAFGCGDNKGANDAKKPDARADAYCSSCPPAPALGAQIDRMGRPAINTALNKGFAPPGATTTAAKDAYNQATDPATWIGFIAQFIRNLAIVDSLDTGVCGNGICETGETNTTCVADCPAAGQTGTLNGCGNQALYNGKSLGDPGNPVMGPNPPNSYTVLSAILTNDELYLDTSKTQCMFYLAVEFQAATGGNNTTCGGRAPAYDVIDFTLSLGAMGIFGFDIPGGFLPRVKDNAGPHTDYLSDFPYLGPPH